MFSIVFLAFSAHSALHEPIAGVWELTSETLNEALETQPDLIVELYSVKCGHCKEFTPYYNGLGEFMLSNHSMHVGRIEVEENSGILSQFNSDKVPTILAFRNKAYFKFNGVKKANIIYKWFMKLIDKPLGIYEDYSEFIEKFDGNSSIVYFGEAHNKQWDTFSDFYQQDSGFQFGIIQKPSKLHKNKAPGVILKTEKNEKIFSLTESIKDLMNFVELNKGIKIHEWSEETKDLTFKQNLNTFFFLCNEEEFDLYLPRIQAVSEKYHEKLMITYADLGMNYTRNLISNGFRREKQPLAAIFDFDGGSNKYACSDVSEQGLLECVDKWENGRLKLYFMSQDSPLKEIENGVRVLTGNNFDKFALNKKKNYLVYFYAKGHTESEKHLKTIERVAYELKDIPDLEIGKLEVNTNELQNTKLSSMPGLKFYPKTHKSGINYENHLGKFGIFHFIKAHSSN